MVTVTLICLVIPFFIQGAFSRTQEAPAVLVTDAPKKTQNDYYTDYGAYDTHDYVGKHPGDVKYVDYGPVYGDHAHYGDYGPQYGDYGPVYGDYGPVYGDYGHYDHIYQYEDDFGLYDDQYAHYGDLFGLGDRGNPLEGLIQVHDETGVQADGEFPWVYVIVPVVQVDVFYVSDEEKIDDIEFQIPIDTFLFELGNLGLGHFALENLSLGGDFMYDGFDDFSYNDYPVYGQLPDADVRANRFDTADELQDPSILDYAGLDHDPFWVDWIFMMPPDNVNPIVR